jgi:hypothetical protein
MWPSHAAEPVMTFSVSYASGTTDPLGQRLGGSEIRALAVHVGKLFAGNGYWEDRPALFGPHPGAEVLVLEGPGRPWRVDHEFEERVPGGQRRHLAVSALTEVVFRTGPHGEALRTPASKLLASTWDITGRRTVFVRDDRDGTWSGTFLAQDSPKPDFLPQIRSFGFHRDQKTGADVVFAGDTAGIFSGTFDAGALGQIAWNLTPELLMRDLAAGDHPGLAGHTRISSFAEAAGRLYAAIGQEVWVRQDGAEPRWQRFYANPAPRFSETGLRGLTAVAEPGNRPYLLTAIEGNASRIVRIDAVSGAETTDLDLGQFLDAAWATRVSYVIGAYNDMTPGPASGDLLIGLEAFIPPASPRPPGHTVLDVMHGLEGGAWFLVRHSGGRYDVHQIAVAFPGVGMNLVAARCFAPSPFPGEAGVFYVGGYDANKTPAHDTAWIARGSFR